MSNPDQTHAQPRSWLATLAVLGAMVAIVGAGGLAASAVAGLPEQPVAVSRGVTVLMPTGWEFGRRSDDGSGILLSAGAASVYIETVEGNNELAALEELRRAWSVEPALAMGEVVKVNARPGTPGARFSYSGSIAEVASPIEGEVTALRGDGFVLIFDGWAGIGDYALARAEIAALIERAQLP